MVKQRFLFIYLKDDGGILNGGKDCSDIKTLTINILPQNDAPLIFNAKILYSLAINVLSQSKPYYISSIIESDWPECDFSTHSCIVKTFANEIVDKTTELHRTWMEHIESTIEKVNDIYGKKSLLILSKDRDKEYARDEIMNAIEWPVEKESELQKKLQQFRN
jgi:hypothetical protein